MSLVSLACGKTMSYNKPDDPSAILESIYKAVMENKTSDNFIFDPVNYEALAHARREDLLSRGNYDQFSEIISYVKSGKSNQLAPLVLSTINQLRLGEMSTNPLRQAQYTFVSIITLISRAAIDSGVDAETSLTLSDAYIQKVDKYTEIQQIALLSIQMVYDYTHRVAKQQNSHKYSYTTQSAIEYIAVHLNYKISVKDIAGHCQMSTSHLSAVFKADTGSTISQYILEQRLTRAKDYLRFSQLSSQEISSTLGFSSPSYFSKIFKEVFSLSPMDFRSQYGHTQLDLPGSNS